MEEESEHSQINVDLEIRLVSYAMTNVRMATGGLYSTAIRTVPQAGGMMDFFADLLSMEEELGTSVKEDVREVKEKETAKGGVSSIIQSADQATKTSDVASAGQINQTVDR